MTKRKVGQLPTDAILQVSTLRRYVKAATSRVGELEIEKAHVVAQAIAHEMEIIQIMNRNVTEPVANGTPVKIEDDGSLTVEDP